MLTLFLLPLGCRDRAVGAERGSETQTPAPEQGSPDAPMNPPKLAESVTPVVVNIVTTEAAPRGMGSFRFFFRDGPSGGEREGREPSLMGLGSGFIIDSAGYVVTNEHVVHDAERVRVRLADGRELEADVVGKDPILDVGLLKLRGAKDLPSAKLGSSAKMRVGDAVMAVGNPYGLGSTVTTGIVSAKERALGLGPYDDFIQTDASINPGNSGGPLFDSQGYVIGMNTAIRKGASGIGFAIPIDAIREVLPELRETGHVERGRLGIAFQEVTPGLAKALGFSKPQGALVADIEEGSPADSAGLEPGDVIVTVDGKDVGPPAEFAREVSHHPPGTKLTMGVIRDHARRDVTVVLGRMPTDEQPESSVSEPPPKDDTQGGLGLGLTTSPGQGVTVQTIARGSPVTELRPGDVIRRVGSRPIRSVKDFQAEIARAAPGSTLLVEIEREGANHFIPLGIPNKP